jgi:hypothetical protein
MDSSPERRSFTLLDSCNGYESKSPTEFQIPFPKYLGEKGSRLRVLTRYVTETIRMISPESSDHADNWR